MAKPPDSFVGIWDVEREVIDSHGQCIATMKGEAKFTPVERGILLYSEDLIHQTEKGRWTAKQEYRYCFSGKQLDIYLMNGMKFASFPFPSLIGSRDIHLCGEDRYEMEFLRFSKQTIAHSICVKGPKKDFLIYSYLNKTCNSHIE